RHTRFDCDWSSDVCSSDLTYNLKVRDWRARLSAWFFVRWPLPVPWVDDDRQNHRSLAACLACSVCFTCDLPAALGVCSGAILSTGAGAAGTAAIVRPTEYWR